MATAPKKLNMAKVNSRELVTALANDMGLNLGTIESNTDLQTMGQSVMTYTTTYNAFYENLLNKIARTIIYNRYYYNHYSALKKGMLDIGETIEEVFIALCDPNPYNVATAEKEVFKTVESKVLAAYYSINIETFYKKTISRKETKKAFYSFAAFDNFVRGLINSMYLSLSYDEECLTKYLIQKNILNGFLHTEAISTTTPEDTMIAMQETALSLTYMRGNNNFAGVPNFAPMEEQFLFISAGLEAQIGVKVLATSFNMELADYKTRRVLFDNFWDNDVERLKMIFAEVPNWEYFSAKEIEFLKTVQAIACHQNLTQIYNVYLNFDYIRNPQGMYTNYFLNFGAIYAMSPFEVAKVFINKPVEIDSVTVDPSTVTVAKGSSVPLSAKVLPIYADTASFEWSLSTSDTAAIPSDNSYITSAGTVYIGADETNATLYAKYSDGTNSGKCTITVQS